MDIQSFVLKKAQEAKEGARAIAKALSGQKSNALIEMAEAIRKKAKELQKANKRDIDAAKKKGLTGAMIDRLTLTTKRIDEMAQGLVEIASLPDPVGDTSRAFFPFNRIGIARFCISRPMMPRCSSASARRAASIP